MTELLFRKHLIIMNKKSLLLSLVALCFMAQVFGQAKCPVKKIYAYKQASLPGIQPLTAENGGGERKETFNYWLYLIIPDSKNININNIWIVGKKFSVKTETVETTPVNKSNNISGAGNETIELVPKTKHRVILIYPSGLNNEAEDLSARILKKIKKNELVFNFTWKEKKRFSGKKLIKVLNPEALP